MRQGQQNRRGRNRGGRKPQNSISRNYESSGPDVKIRGTAMHIAEKYSSLARDAMASGDMVGAENYLQHAEHYNRIIMAAQALNPNVPGMEGQGGGMNGGGRYNPSEHFQRDFDGGSDDDDGDDFPQQKPFHDRGSHDRGPRERSPNYNQHQQPQPYIPQQAFPQTQQPHQPAPAAAANGEPAHAAEQEQPAPAEGDRGPRRRRRRPIGEAPKSYNGRNGASHGPAEGLNGAVPNGPAPDESVS